jgi:3-vinyl bacteriochlorophyllide hydratase
VQGVLAPLQFAVMLVSTVLVVRSLTTGVGVGIADASVVLKTGLLYAIMVTGSLWEKDVFGKYLFAGPFFWEDVVSMGVIALHSAYLLALFGDLLGTQGRLLLALAAYAAYGVNAVQFLVKFRMARRGRATGSTAGAVS